MIRMMLALPLLMVAACNVDNDAANDSVTLEYNESQVRSTVEEVGNAAGEVAAGVGNVAASAGRAIENEVGDVDVDVDVNRDRRDNPAANSQ